MTDINRTPAEVCVDRNENIGNNCWQTQECGCTVEHAEIFPISNIPTFDKEEVSISVINVTFIAAPFERWIFQGLCMHLTNSITTLVYDHCVESVVLTIL